MFTKLPLIFNTVDVDWHQFKSDSCFDKYYSEDRNGGSYFYTIKDFNLFRNLLKPNVFKIRPDFMAYCEFTGDGLVSPHRDNGTSVALNFYIDTDDGITIFYKETEKIIDTLYSKKLNFSKTDKDLIEISRFKANKNDCYLLDVSCIHGIKKTTKNARSMITARWEKHSFDIILDSLNFQ
jgi:hypothetical protein